MSDFSDFLEALDDSFFEEKPVDLHTFLYDEHFLNLPPLSQIQEDVVFRGSQVYRPDALTELYGAKEADRIWKQTTRDLLLMLGKGCTAPYTEVFNAENGTWNRLDSLDTDGHVVGLTGKPEYRTEAFKEGHGEMLRFTTELGLTEDVYVGHKFWAMRKQRFYKRNERDYFPEDIQADELKPGDRIAVGLNMPVMNEKGVGEDTAWIAAVLLGDGCMPQTYSGKFNNRVSVDFGREEKQSLERYLEIVRSHGDNPSVVSHKNKQMETVYHSVKNSPWIFKLVEDFDMIEKSANTKEIPEQIWALPVNELYQFIGGMWQTDGTIYYKKCKSETQSLWVAEWCSVSKSMAYDFQKLLLRAGIPASIRSKVPSYTYKGEKHKGQRAYILTISGQDKLTEFNKKIVLFDYKRDKQSLAIERAKEVNKSYGRIFENLYFDRVKKIEPIGEGDFWTLTNPETSHYNGNGMISRQSGKDFLSQITCLYAVYKLLCLKDPAAYFGKPAGDSIDIANLAINAKQAKRVFFDGLVTRLKRAPWFDGKYGVRMDDVAFDKNINLYSLHSNHESAEGINAIIAVLDEIDGFEVEGQADAIYKALSGTVSSRFADVGKVISLSFPRSKDGFMMRKYNDAVTEVDISEHEHTFKLNEELEDNLEGNEFTVTWTEEEVLGYKYDNIFALKAPTFRVNPIKSIEDYKMDFYSDESDTLMRVCANPPDFDKETFFANHEKIDEVFSAPNGWLDGDFNTKPVEDAEYFIHVDLSKVSDRTVVAMGHISDWIEPHATSRIHTDAQPFITIDLFRVWEPSRKNPVNDAEVMDFIMLLAKKFNVELVTFDQWHSFDNIQYLESVGVNSKKRSLKREDYLEFRTALYESRLSGPYDERLLKELKNLIIIKGKVDHPPGKEHFNDISEAVTGVIVNCIENTVRDTNLVVDTLANVRRDLQRDEQGAKVDERPEMPGYLREFMDGWTAI